MASSNNNGERTIALGMPPLPPTSERMTGQSSQMPNMDPQKLKRTLANRQHARNHHHRRISHMMKLERTVQFLEGDVKSISGQICYLKEHNDMLLAENDELKQKLCFRALEIDSKEDEHVQLKKEKDELKEEYVVKQQNYEELMKRNMENAQFLGTDQLGRPSHSFM